MVSILAHPERWALRASRGFSRWRYPVSILAHPERWALRGTAIEQPNPPTGFNPRPPRKVGATMRNRREAVESDVSILAHPERWALPISLCLQRSHVTVSILAHPERWALPAGAVYASRGPGVSILAHPERWALQCRLHRYRPHWPFQSSPTPKGGRYAKEADQCLAVFKFQSSPTPKGGRYSDQP